MQLRYDKGLVTDLDVERAKAILSATEALIPTFEIGVRKRKTASAS